MARERGREAVETPLIKILDMLHDLEEKMDDRFDEEIRDVLLQVSAVIRDLEERITDDQALRTTLGKLVNELEYPDFEISRLKTAVLI